MSDYRELPERVAAAIAQLLAAEKRADESVIACRRCGHVETMRVVAAESELLYAIRTTYCKGPLTTV